MHLYNALHYKPWASASEFLSKHRGRWHQQCIAQAVSPSLPEAQKPCCSVAAMWSLFSMMCTGRSVTAAQLTSYLKVADALWLLCEWSGTLHTVGSAFTIELGKANWHHVVDVAIADESIRNAMRSKLCATFGASIHMPVPSILLMVDRYLANYGGAAKCQLALQAGRGHIADIAAKAWAVLEKSLCTGAACIHDKMPSNTISRYLFRCGKSVTNDDSRQACSTLSNLGPGSTLAVRDSEYAQHNVLYLGASTRTLDLGFHKFKALHIVADEVGFKNSKCLQAFASCYLADDISFGVCLPPQLMPAMHVDFNTTSIAARIKTQFGNGCGHGRGGGQHGRGGGQHGRGGGRRGRGGGRRGRGQPQSINPQADPLVPTWHLEVGLDNALRGILEPGLKEFRHRPQTLPLQRGYLEYT